MFLNSMKKSCSLLFKVFLFFVALQFKVHSFGYSYVNSSWNLSFYFLCLSHKFKTFLRTPILYLETNNREPCYFISLEYMRFVKHLGKTIYDTYDIHILLLLVVNFHLVYFQVHFIFIYVTCISFKLK